MITFIEQVDVEKAASVASGQINDQIAFYRGKANPDNPTDVCHMIANGMQGARDTFLLQLWGRGLISKESYYSLTEKVRLGSSDGRAHG